MERAKVGENPTSIILCTIEKQTSQGVYMLNSPVRTFFTHFSYVIRIGPENRLCAFTSVSSSYFERIHGLQAKKAIGSDIRREPGMSPFLETHVAKKREVCLRCREGKSGRIDIALDEERRREPPHCTSLFIFS
jgi:hypothetical protein